ncbi:hypothetical protein NLI96_g4668 [Meripilus lineatus]|uniref:F-box domain-containing protein n=1 Tax=Meripilus lineatus TaxID=2056292 RepID=A0AAD5V9R2_9APHY|nr:hypothetical protein NLI96_g4668 [Physisporinus lineatus]
MLPARNQNLEEHRTRLHERIEAAAKTLQELREECNLYADTSRLPPEILVMIFLCVARRVHRTVGSPREMLRLTHVCRQWRRVALQCQEFWSYVPLQPRWPGPIHIDAINPFPDRSGDRLLKVSLTIYPTDEIQLTTSMGDLLSVFDRTSSLILWFLEDMDLDSVESTMTGLDDFVPDLESVVLRTSVIYGVHGMGAFFFDREMPGLRRLSMDRGIHFYWTEDIFKPTLTHLELHRTLEPSFTAMIEALRQMPLIQSFIYDDEYKRPRDRHFEYIIQRHDEQDPLPWPHLRHLKLSTDTEAVNALCSYLQLPPQTILDFSVRDYKISEPDDTHPDGLKYGSHFYETISLIADHCTEGIWHASGCFLQFVCTKSTSFDGYTLRLSLGKQCHSVCTHQSPLSNPSITLKSLMGVGAGETGADFLRPIFQSIISRLDTSHITALYLDYPPEIANLEVLRAFSNLRSIHLTGTISDAILGLLTTPHDSIRREHEKEPTTQILCPDLHLLSFLDACILPTLLLDLVDSRQAAGHPIERISITECHIDDATVQKVREKGVIVHWDEQPYQYVGAVSS